MAGSFIAQDFLAAFADFLVIVLAVKGEDRGQFFIGVRMAAADTVFLGDQDPGFGWDVDFRQPGNHLDTAADDLGIHGPIAAQDELAQLPGLVR